VQNDRLGKNEQKMLPDVVENAENAFFVQCL
jgi:hypothetical protein